MGGEECHNTCVRYEKTKAVKEVEKQKEKEEEKKRDETEKREQARRDAEKANDDKKEQKRQKKAKELVKNDEMLASLAEDLRSYLEYLAEISRKGTVEALIWNWDRELEETLKSLQIDLVNIRDYCEGAEGKFHNETKQLLAIERKIRKFLDDFLPVAGKPKKAAPVQEKHLGEEGIKAFINLLNTLYKVILDLSRRTKYTSQNICIYSYGSLINDPGKDLASHIVGSEEFMSPFKVEFARSSKSRFGAPTLVIHNKGRKVLGRILVTDIPYTENNMAKVKSWVNVREGKPGMSTIKNMKMKDFEHVIYCDIPGNIEKPDADILAKLAIASVKKCKTAGIAGKNGIRYLIDAYENGIDTPLMNKYHDTILKIANISAKRVKRKKCKSLEDVEEWLLSK